VEDIRKQSVKMFLLLSDVHILTIWARSSGPESCSASAKSSVDGGEGSMRGMGRRVERLFAKSSRRTNWTL